MQINIKFSKLKTRSIIFFKSIILRVLYNILKYYMFGAYSTTKIRHSYKLFDSVSGNNS